MHHEFGHSFVDGALERWRDLYLARIALFEPIAREMTERGYPSWSSCLNEHIVRAVVCRLALRHSGAALAERMVRSAGQLGFRYLDALYRRLAEYEAQPHRYKSFAGFVPRLLEALDAPAAP